MKPTVIGILQRALEDAHAQVESTKSVLQAAQEALKGAETDYAAALHRFNEINADLNPGLR